MKMEPEIIIALVATIGCFSMTGEGRAHQAAGGCARDRITTCVTASGDRVNVPVVAPVRSHRIAGNLNKSSFRRRRLRPVGCKVDPEFVAVRIEEVHDGRTRESLAGGHPDHAVRNHRAFIFDVCDHIIRGEGRIGDCCSPVGNLNRTRKADADLARGRIQGAELPVAPDDAVVAIGRQEAGNGFHAVKVGSPRVTLNVHSAAGRICAEQCGCDGQIAGLLRASRKGGGREEDQQNAS